MPGTSLIREECLTERNFIDASEQQLSREPGSFLVPLWGPRHLDVGRSDTPLRLAVATWTYAACYPKHRQEVKHDTRVSEFATLAACCTAELHRCD